MSDRELLDELKRLIEERLKVKVYEGEFTLRSGETAHFYFENL
jgi:orotate phosphoribosyltransferase